MRFILKYFIFLFLVDCSAPGRSSYDLANFNYLESLVLWDAGVNIQSFNLTNFKVTAPSEILKTGQTISYQTGDDGTYQKGNDRTFIVGGQTGLIWQRCTAGQVFNLNCIGSAQSYFYSDAENYCNNLTIGGRTWRLPTVNELANLVDYGKSSSPTIDSTSFPNTQSSYQSSYYWSSSMFGQGAVYYVDFYGGSVNIAPKTGFSCYVRCVTGP